MREVAEISGHRSLALELLGAMASCNIRDNS